MCYGMVAVLQVQLSLLLQLLLLLCRDSCILLTATAEQCSASQLAAALAVSKSRQVCPQSIDVYLLLTIPLCSLQATGTTRLSKPCCCSSMPAPFDA
jgi:hypothetical protein